MSSPPSTLLPARARTALTTIPTDEEKQALEEQIEALQKITDYEIREWPLQVLVDMYTDGLESDNAVLFIPDYQREFVWSAKQQSRFIESLLMNLPIPYIFAADVAHGERAGQLEIVDGSQRVRTLDNFLSNRLTLVGLKKLNTANGFRFSDLPVARQLRLKRKTLRMIELNKQADEEARRELFDRLNTGGTKLEPSETRRGVYDGPFMRFITSLAEDLQFRRLCPLGAVAVSRKEYEEFVLRYFAYANDYANFRKNVDGFLTDYLKTLNSDWGENREAQFTADFRSMLAFVERHFPNGFRRSPKHTTVPRIRFEAISVGVSLALRESPDLEPDRVSPWLDGEAFQRLTRSDASNSRPRVVNRIHFVRDNLLGRPVQYDADTQNVEANANADAPDTDEKQFSLL